MLNLVRQKTVSSRFKKYIFLILTQFIFLYPSFSLAVGLDLLGDIAAPLLGPAKDKTQGLFKYLWAQPYFGYGLGDGTLTEDSSGSSVSSSLGYEGFFYGARGGLELFNSFKIGADFIQQFGKRKEQITETDGTRSEQRVASKNTALGVMLGFDIPHTPVQAFASRYFLVNLETDTISRGTGYGTGISFMIVNPFILLLEYRWFNIAADVRADGVKPSRTMKQYYAGLSFLLF